MSRQHRQPGKAPSSDPTAQVPSAPGKLPAGVQHHMESSFGRSFDDVRVHHGGEAAGLGAEAFARGNEIHFAPGRYDPASTSGLALIGHELAHVVQQAEGRVGATTQARGLVSNEDCVLEAEADRAGAAAARGERVTLSSSRASAPAEGPVVQGKFILPAKTGPRPASGSYSKELHVADDATLAIHPSSKVFSATPDRVKESNTLLEAVGSKFRLREEGGGGNLFSLDGTKQALVDVIGENQEDKTSGPDLSGPIRCNEMAEAVVGKPQTGHATTTGLERAEHFNFGVDLATYASTYATTPKGHEHEAATAAVDTRHKDIAHLPQTEKFEPGVEITLRPSKDIEKKRKEDRKADKEGRDVVKRDELSMRLLKIVGTSGGVLQNAGADNQGRQRAASTDRSQAEKLLQPLIADGLCKSLKIEDKPVRVGLDTRAHEKQDQNDAAPFQAMNDKDRASVAKELRLDQYAEPDVGGAYGIFPVRPMSAKKESGFPYHFGGVVAKAGADTMTLENFFLPRRTATDNFFNLYGPLQNVSAKASGRVTREATTDEERESGSFHAQWSSSFSKDTPITTALGTSKRTVHAHPGPVKDGTDEETLRRAADLVLYWRDRWAATHDPKDAKTALDEIGTCRTAVCKAIDAKLLDDAEFTTLRDELRNPKPVAKLPEQASWGLGPVVERPRHGEVKAEPRVEVGRPKDEEDEVKAATVPNISDFDRAYRAYELADPSNKQAAAAEALRILKLGYHKIAPHYEGMGQLEDLDETMNELLKASA